MDDPDTVRLLRLVADLLSQVAAAHGGTVGRIVGGASADLEVRAHELDAALSEQPV